MYGPERCRVGASLAPGRGGQFAGTAAEAGAEQGLLVAGADHRLAVEFLDRQLRQLARRDRIGEGAHRRRQLLARIELGRRRRPRPPRSTKTTGLAVAQQQVGAGSAGRAAAALEFRPGQRGTVGVGRIGRREDQVGAVGFGQRAQALDRAGQRELGAAEALDEVAAASGAEQLEVAELRVEGGEAAGDALGEDRLTGDDAVALQHQLGLGAQAGTGGRGRWRRAARSGTSVPGRRRRRSSGGGRSGGRWRSDGGDRAQARRPQRREGVVGDLARPGEVPERVVELLGRVVEVGEQVEPEGRARRRAARGSRRGPRPRGRSSLALAGGGPARRTSSRK